MKEIIENEVENIFNTLSSYFNLKSGDITPMQSIQVDEFKLMLEEWIKQNQEVKLISIDKYVGFLTFEAMQDFIKKNWDNKPKPNITGHGYSNEYKHFFEVGK